MNAKIEAGSVLARRRPRILGNSHRLPKGVNLALGLKALSRPVLEEYGLSGDLVLEDWWEG